jgi:EAL domain-containing protein (putative c-di-GMP-specific phosphodiesterase class I)
MSISIITLINFYPTLGLVRASEFIPLEEETGLILPIGEFQIKNETLHGAARVCGLRFSFQKKLQVNKGSLSSYAEHCMLYNT